MKLSSENVGSRFRGLRTYPCASVYIASTYWWRPASTNSCDLENLAPFCLPQSRLSDRHSAIYALLRALRGRIGHLRYP